MDKDDLVKRLQELQRRWVSIVREQGFGDQLDGDFDTLAEIADALSQQQEKYDDLQAHYSNELTVLEGQNKRSRDEATVVVPRQFLERVAVAQGVPGSTLGAEAQHYIDLAAAQGEK